MFIAISGISGSGKNTVMHHLTKMRSNLKILERSTATTRERRESDETYQTYIYMSEEEFKKGIDKGIFIEYENVHGFYYGTLKEAFQKVIEDKENDYARDIDVKGVINLKKYLTGKVDMVTIFLDAPDEELKSRLLKRGESKERVEARLSRGKLERSYKDNYDLVIENIDLNSTLQIINDFIDKRRGIK